jgi:cytochrome c peroxidase
MGSGARADRRADRLAHAQRRGELALRVTARIALVAGAWCALAASGAHSESYDWQLPRGFPQPAVPADNPMSETKVALGRKLFFDTRLSVSGRDSCASCHDPAKSFTDGRAVAVGATGEKTPHSAMALVNVGYNIAFGWTKPNVRSLEQQMLEPMLNEHPVELGLKGREAQVAAKLGRDPQYAAAFAASFPDAAGGVRFEHIVKAIAAYERTLISGSSPFDAYVFRGEHDALPAAARRGMALFFSQRTGCAGCHSGFNFAGNWMDVQGATGEASFARNGVGDAAMRVPTLRNIALTAPYMHDGRFPSLAAVLDHYVAVNRKGLSLSADERSDLLAFLDSLTDPQFVAGGAAADGEPDSLSR